MRNAYNIAEFLMGKDHLEDLDTDGKIILKYILGK
jgi:hypothetical protein